MFTYTIYLNELAGKNTLPASEKRYCDTFYFPISHGTCIAWHMDLFQRSQTLFLTYSALRYNTSLFKTR